MNKPLKTKLSQLSHFISTECISYVSILLLFFSLPFDRKVSIVALAFFGVFSIIYIIKNIRSFHWKALTPKPLFLISLYALISFASIIYSSNLKYAFSKSESLVYLFFIPLILFILPEINKKQFDIVLATFCFSCFLSTIPPLIRFIGYYREYSEITLWVIDDSLFIHRAYFGMYLVLCLFIVISFFYRTDKKISKIKFSILIFYFVYILLFLVLTLPKIALAAVVILLVLAIIYYRYSKFKIISTLITLIPLISVLFIIGYININLYLLDTQFAEVEENYTLTHQNLLEIINNSSHLRFSHWANAYLAWFKDFKSFTFGYGIGDVKDVLNEYYAQKELSILASRNFNAHNTLLQISLATGLVGLIVFISILLISLHNGIKSRNHFLVFFIILFVICSSTESMLMRQKGVLFFVSFLALFSLYTGNWKSKHNH